MRIEYLFTVSREGKLASKLIANATGKLHPEIKPCSHVAIKLGPIVVESTLTKGANIQPYQEWIKHNKVVHAFRCPVNRKAIEVLTNCFSNVWGKKYDYKGIAYFAWRMLGFLLFKRPLPKINRWERKTHYFCVELVASITGQQYSMTSPIQLAKKWYDLGIEQIDPSIYK